MAGPFGVRGHPKGCARYTVSTTALTLSTAPTAGDTLPDGAVTMLIQNLDSTNDVRWRDDGTAPTATEGMRLEAGAIMEYDGDLAAFQMIREDAGDVSVVISYYGI